MRDCFSTCRDISIHAPHTRSDLKAALEQLATEFQSTPLIRGATVPMNNFDTQNTFQSTPLIRGATYEPRG